MRTRSLYIACSLAFLLPAIAQADSIADFAFTTVEQSVDQDTPSGELTVEADGSSGTAVNGNTVCLQLTSSSPTPQFSTNASTWGTPPITTLALTVSTSEYRRNFYYQDATAGTYTLTLAAGLRTGSSCTGWSGSSAQWSATQTIVVGGGATGTEQNDQNSSNSDNSGTSTSDADTQSQQVSTGGASSAVPTLAAKITTAATVVAGGGSFFSGQAYASDGSLVGDARYVWNFGDGATEEGQTVFHTYSYPGKYAVYLTVADGVSDGTVRTLVVAAPAAVGLLSETDGSLVIEDESAQELDVGLWSIDFGTSTFVLPKNTTVLGENIVRLPPATLGFWAGPGSTLHYPNSVLAATAVGDTGGTAAVPPALAPIEHTQNNPAAAAPASAKASTPRAPAKIVAAKALPPVPTTTEAAAALASGASLPFLSIGMGVVALAALGLAGAWYVRGELPLRAGSAPELSETSEEAAEFEIDD